MLRRLRFPCLVWVVVLLCCLGVAAGCFLLFYPNMGLLLYLVNGGLQPIDAFPTAPPREAQATILFSDDFSNPNSGWRVGEWDEGRAAYQDGGYRFEVGPDTNMSSLIAPSLPSDISLEVDVSVTSPSNSKSAGYFGVICRFQDNNGNRSGHEFTLGGDRGGFFPPALTSIGTLVGPHGINSEAGEYEDVFLFPSDWGNTYHVRADCIGDQLSLYVNGRLIQRARTSTRSKGTDIGLFAGRETMTRMQYVFDNLVVYQP